MVYIQRPKPLPLPTVAQFNYAYESQDNVYCFEVWLDDGAVQSLVKFQGQLVFVKDFMVSVRRVVLPANKCEF